MVGEEPARIEQRGRSCAESGGQFRDNPFLDSPDSWKYLAWVRGFRAARITDPLCAMCHGTGKVLGRSEPPGEYDPVLECHCNVAR